MSAKPGNTIAVFDKGSTRSFKIAEHYDNIKAFDWDKATLSWKSVIITLDPNDDIFKH